VKVGDLIWFANKYWGLVVGGGKYQEEIVVWWTPPGCIEYISWENAINNPLMKVVNESR